MYRDALGCHPRIPVRIIHKNILLLVSLPVVTFVFLLVYSPLDSSVVNIDATERKQQPIREFQVQQRTLSDHQTTGVNVLLTWSVNVSKNSLDDRLTKLEGSIQKALKEVNARQKAVQGSNFKKKGLEVNIPKPESANIRQHASKENNVQKAIGEVNGQQMVGKTARNFTIHVWKHGERMKRRFLRSYGMTNRDPYAFCSVKNCRLTTDDARVNDSDAVLFHLHQTLGPKTLPSSHPSHQIWIFFTDESPKHTFLATRDYAMKDYNGLFNWSMTYRADSDVPVPYGRTLPLSAADKRTLRYKNYAASKQKGVAILGSNCGGQNFRWEYVKELQKYIPVDVYGGCGTHKCPGHFMRDCPSIGDYKFYLAFENSNCREYITEKLWWNAFNKETVPVVMGASKSDYEKLCPPNSFIHTGDFKKPEELAKYLNFLMANDTAYNSYFSWKKQYKVVNEHGYFGSPSLHLCRICEALNNADTSKPKTYTNLSAFWNSKSDCRKASWSPNS